MNKPISLTFYSDVLCIWAHIAQVRVEEVKQQFGDKVDIDYRFCSVFGDCNHKIALGWADRDGYNGFAAHLQELAVAFPHIKLHPGIWKSVRPYSSGPAHLILKAVQKLAASQVEPLLIEVRKAFFEEGRDIGQRDVLESVLENTSVSIQSVRDLIASGEAYALLEADTRDKQALMIQGSPTFILNEGRQKLYGNVGYGVIEANIQELLRAPMAEAASWC